MSAGMEMREWQNVIPRFLIVINRGVWEDVAIVFPANSLIELRAHHWLSESHGCMIV
jgi:hypothetical protein